MRPEVDDLWPDSGGEFGPLFLYVVPRVLVTAALPQVRSLSGLTPGLAAWEPGARGTRVDDPGPGDTGRTRESGAR